jgi:hypothetical protein
MPKSQRKKLQADIDNSLILLSLALLTSPLGARMDARFRVSKRERKSKGKTDEKAFKQTEKFGRIPPLGRDA